MRSSCCLPVVGYLVRWIDDNLLCAGRRGRGPAEAGASIGRHR